MRSKLTILIGLAVLLIVVVAWRVAPNWPRLQAAIGHMVQVNGSGARKAVTNSDDQFTTSPLLRDGSFNPLPPHKAKLEESPAAQVGQSEWREQYRPLLEQIRPAADSPGFAVYPFLDQTPDGVGLICTYGWRPVGVAALATWTRARVTGFAEPERYGLPPIDTPSSATAEATAAPAALSLDDWLKHALADKAASDARYVISGRYTVSPDHKECRLTIGLADRATSGATPSRILHESAIPLPATLPNLTKQQREAARAVAQALISIGVTTARPKPQTKGLKLDAELAAIAQLLDANDSWAVMEGIDRALQLATLFPEESAPLQAAAYGYGTLGWTLFEYAYGNVHRYDIAMRAFALAQIALSIDPRPALSRMNYAYASSTLVHTASERLKDIDGTRPGEGVPELSGYLSAIEDRQDINPSARLTAHLPDWQVLNIEAHQSWFVHSSNYRHYFNDRLSQWPGHDFYQQAAIQNCFHDWYNSMAMDDTLKSIGGKLNPFAFVAYGSTLATRATVAAELASLFAAQPQAAPGDPFIAAMAQALIMSEDELRNLAVTGDYYKLRDKLIATTQSWDPPSSAEHPAYGMLPEMAKKANEIYQSAALTRAPAGYLGFEFSPAERVRVAQWRDNLGPMLLAELEGSRRAVYETLDLIGQAYLKGRPDNAAVYADLIPLYANFPDNLAARNQYHDMLKTQYRIYPLDTRSIYKLGRYCYFEAHPEMGERYLAEYQHIDPFDPFRHKEIGELYQRYGYHGKAVEYLALFRKEMPERYDIANEWAWSMCQLGHADDPAVRETYALPPVALPGNGQFHEDNLNFLYYWAKDKKAARAAAEAYRNSTHSGGAGAWLAWLEKDDGNTTKALEFLAEARPVPGMDQGLGLAIFHASMCNHYIDYNRLDLAEQHLKKAMAIDRWQANVIYSMANLASAKGDYDQAIKEHQRGLERYGFDSDHLWAIADCYDKKGQPDEGLHLLEQQFQAENKLDSAIVLAPRLIRYYADRKDAAKARAMMDLILRTGCHKRKMILDAAADYKKIQPDEAAVIEQRINDIMVAPLTLDQLLAGKTGAGSK